MYDYIELGPVPANEDCAQVGQPNFHRDSTTEMDAYIQLLYRAFPKAEELNIFFVKKWFPHDFGTYGEVIAKYDADNEESTNYVFNVIDKDLPGDWDNEARKVLGL